MTRAVALLGLVALLAGAARAADPLVIRRELAFARLQSAHFGIAGAYDVIRCGADCTWYRPRVFVTADGRSWREITPPHVLFELEDVVFATPRLGWVVANDCVRGKAFVYRTRDGGRTWRAAPVRATNCSAGSRLALSFEDRRHGWLLDVFGNGQRDPLSRTVDGGKTWREVTASAPLQGTTEFVTSREGWLGQSWFAYPQGLFETRSGGRAWRQRRLPPPPGWHGARIFPDTPTFFGRSGVLPVDLVRGRRNAIAFYVTANRGETWRVGAVRPVAYSIAKSGFPRYVPTSIVSQSLWWVAGTRVAVTADGGSSWHTARAPAIAADVSASDDRRAWLTSNGALYATSNRGRTWRRLALPAP